MIQYYSADGWGIEDIIFYRFCVFDANLFSKNCEFHRSVLVIIIIFLLYLLNLRVVFFEVNFFRNF